MARIKPNSISALVAVVLTLLVVLILVEPYGGVFLFVLLGFGALFVLAAIVLSSIDRKRHSSEAIEEKNP